MSFTTKMIGFVAQFIIIMIPVAMLSIFLMSLTGVDSRIFAGLAGIYLGVTADDRTEWALRKFEAWGKRDG